MRKLYFSGCLVGLVLATVPARATFIQHKTAFTELVGGADIIIVGKVTKVHKDLTTALPDRKATKKEYYQIAEVTVKEGLQGAKGLTKIKTASLCMQSFIQGAAQKHVPMVQLAEGAEACFFLKRHYSGKFYQLGRDQLFFKMSLVGR